MDFFQYRKRQQYLLLAVIGMVIVIAGILFYGNYSERALPLEQEPEARHYRKPIINWEMLESQDLKDLQMP